MMRRAGEGSRAIVEPPALPHRDSDDRRAHCRHLLGAARRSGERTGFLEGEARRARENLGWVADAEIDQKI